MTEEKENIFKECKLLESECLEKEITNYLEGFTLINILKEAGEWVLIYTKGKSDVIYLSIAKDSISITAYKEHSIESIHISRYLRLTHQVLEKRDKGILYRDIKKEFNKHILTSLNEDRYVFTNATLKRLFGSIETKKIEHLLIKLYILALKRDLKDYADYHSGFKTYHDKYPWEEFRSAEVSENVKTYLNDEDISHIYDLAGTNDKLLRIHDLYQGIINNRNERDINAISAGFLSPDAFDLLGLKGIRDIEDSLIEKNKDKVSSDYLNYLRNLLASEYNYLGNFTLERNELLKAIVFDETSFDYYPLEPSGEGIDIIEEITKRHL